MASLDQRLTIAREKNGYGKRFNPTLEQVARLAGFNRIMTHAKRSGVSGYLAGITYWLKTLSYYPRLDCYEKHSRHTSW